MSMKLKIRASRAKFAGIATGMLAGSLISFAFDSLPLALGASAAKVKLVISRAMPCDDFQSLGKPVVDEGKASIVALQTDTRLALRIDHQNGTSTYEDLALDSTAKSKNLWVGPEHMVEFTKLKGRPASASVVLMRDPIVHAQCVAAI